MLAIEALKVGDTVVWPISDLMSRTSNDVSFVDEWEDELEMKREDGHYSAVVESIRDNGFLRPLNARLDRHGRPKLTDGHHRIAAAIDLGIDVVPIHIYDRTAVASDSGMWSRGEEVLMDLEDTRGWSRSSACSGCPTCGA